MTRTAAPWLPVKACLAAVVLLLGLAFGASPAAAQNGTITGTITNSADGAALTNVWVDLYDAAGNGVSPNSRTGSNASGVYTISVPPGTYYPKTWNQAGFINRVWDGATGTTCVPCVVQTVGTAVTVTAGNTSTANFTLTLGSRLSGTITRADTGAPVQGETVGVFSSTGQWVGESTSSLSTGVFQTSGGLPPGTYFAWIYYSPNGLINQVYNGLVCLGCSVVDGTPIVVTGTATTGNINFSLSPGGTIGGTIVNAETAAKVVSAQINFFNSVGQYVTYSFTNSAGDYTSYSGLPPGTYFARTVANNNGLLNQMYDGINCQIGCFAPAGTPITVTAVGAKSVADFALQPGARISGTVTRAAGGAPVPNLTVNIYNSAGSGIASVSTNASGVFTTQALETGSYFVATSSSSTLNLMGQVYAQPVNQTCVVCSPVSLGTPVTTSSPNTTTGINFALAAGASITGTVTSGGSPVSGVGVQVSNSAGSFVTSAATSGTGAFTLAGLSDGNYYVRTVSNSAGLINVVYDGAGGTTCLNCSVTAVGTPIAVAIGVSTPAINLVLVPGKTVTGTITDAGGAPIRGVGVSIYSSGGSVVGSGSSNTLGVWTTNGLPAGTYYAKSSNSLGYVDQLYAGLVCPACSTTSGTAIDLTGPASSATVNFSLTEGARVNGSVTSGGQPLGGVNVAFYTSAGTFLTSGASLSNGNYITFGGLPTGTYYAQASLTGYVNQLFNAIQCNTSSCAPISGTPIAVTVGTPKTGIDFAMTLGGRVTGRISDNASSATPPAAIEGVTVSIYDALTAAFIRSGTSTASGTYTVVGLPAGNYVARTSNSVGFINELYDDSKCASCSVTAGKAFTVSAGATTGGINFGLDRGGRISGTVTAAAGGAPLASVTVAVYDAFNRFVISAATLQNGVYTTGGIAPGTYFVRTTSNTGGYINQLYQNLPCASCNASVGVPVTVTGTATTTGINFALAAGGSISGRVTDSATPTPAGLSPVTVQVFDYATQAFVSSVSTNSLGQYTVSGLASGTYSVRTANSLGYANKLYDAITCTSCGAFTATPVAVVAGATKSGINFALVPGATITGTVTGAGNLPIGGINVQIYHPNGLVVQTVATGANGTYRAIGLSPGPYFVKTSNTLGYVDKLYNDTTCLGCNAVTGAPVTVTGAATTAGIDFSLVSGGQVTGTITSRLSGLPLESVSVNIYTASGFFVTSSVTNGAGTYRTSGIPAGSYFARTSNSRGLIDQLYSAKDCTNCNPTTGTPVVVTNGALTSNVDFSLGSGGRVRGTVTGNGGLPVAGVTVNVYAASGSLVTSGSSDSQGNYSTIGGLPTGTYYSRTSNSAGLINEIYDDLTCAGCGVATGKPIAVLAGADTTGINYALVSGGRIAGLVTDTSATPVPIANATVQVFSATGALMATTTTGSSGRYLTSSGLPTGSYFVKVSAGGGLISVLYKLQTAPPHQINCPSCTPLTGSAVAVTAGATTADIDFALTAGGIITGTIVDAGTGAPLSGVTVTIHDSTNGLVASAVSDTGGRYTSGSGMPSGTYYARTNNLLGYVNEVYNNTACLNCLPSSGAPVAVTAGATTGGVDFNLVPGGRIAGTVTDIVTGLPVSNTFINVHASDGKSVTTTSTDNAGNFITTGGLPAGTYFATASAFAQGYVFQLYNNLVCIVCDKTRGAPIAVTTGNTTASINFALALGGSIAGRVTAADTAAGAGNVEVSLFSGQGSYMGSSRTNGDGRFAVTGVPAGSYLLRTTNLQGLVDEAYDNVACAPCPMTAATATAVAVTARTITSGINFALDAGGLVTGIVTDAATGAPLQGVTVSFFQGGVFKGRSQKSDDQGFYAISLPAGTYTVVPDPLHGYAIGVTPGSRTAAATTVTVTKGVETPSVSFPLSACTPPTVSPSTLTIFTSGQPYTQTLTASGGTAPYSFSVSSGSLPPGLTLNAATGVISGTPSVSGTASFSVSASDATGCAGTADFTPFVCGVSVGTSQASYTSAAGAGSLAIAANATDCAWTATSNAPWLTLGGAGGTGSGTLGYTVAANPATTGLRTGTITVAGNAVTVTQGAAVTSAPFGSFDTPNATGTISGSVAVTGWALDDLAVDRVEIWRDRVAGETTPLYPGPGPGTGKIYIATPLFISGARPDVASAFASYPFANRAGWGYLMLTQGLWNQGNGTYTLYAFAFDAEGKSTTLGSKTITVDNANATKPFGGIDVPTYGQTVSGGFWNFGWGLTPGSTCTIVNGSVQVGIDSQPLTPVNYGDARTDIAAAFPGFTNGAGAGGAYYIDTTTLTDGAHQIGWYVVDNCARADGVGSRFFTVANGTPSDTVPDGAALEAGLEAPAEGITAARAIARVVPDEVTVQANGGEAAAVATNADGLREVKLRQGSRIALQLPAAGGTYSAYQVANGAQVALPLGSSFNTGTGTFYWEPAAGYLGSYDLVFVAPDGAAVPVRVVVQ